MTDAREHLLANENFPATSTLASEFISAAHPLFGSPFELPRSCPSVDEIFEVDFFLCFAFFQTFPLTFHFVCLSFLWFSIVPNVFLNFLLLLEHFLRFLAFCSALFTFVFNSGHERKRNQILGVQSSSKIHQVSSNVGGLFV